MKLKISDNVKYLNSQTHSWHFGVIDRIEGTSATIRRSLGLPPVTIPLTQITKVEAESKDVKSDT